MPQTKTIPVSTSSTTEFINITRFIKNAVQETGVRNGLCMIFVPHTTAGVTINENADPSVVRDILKEVNKVIPFDDGYNHLEGNSAAHIKASLFGASETIIIEDGNLVLGTWQGIFFCEFDGPRSRKVIMKITEG